MKKTLALLGAISLAFATYPSFAENNVAKESYTKQGINFRNADPIDGILITSSPIRPGANLKGANLMGAKLQRANLNGAIIDKKALKGAKIAPTQLVGMTVM